MTLMKVSAMLPTKRPFYTRDFGQQSPVGGESILNKLTEGSGTGQGAEGHHGSVCYPRRRGGELKSFTAWLLTSFRLSSEVLQGRGRVRQELGGEPLQLSSCTSWKTSSEQMALLL